MEVQKLTNDIPQAQTIRQRQAINGILTTENSIGATYTKILDKFESNAKQSRLKQFRDEHAEVAQFWDQQIHEMGSKNNILSQILQNSLTSILSLSKFFGSTITLKLLKVIEVYVLNRYEILLRANFITDFQKLKIKNTLIPRQRLHIEGLQAMIRMG